MAQIENYSVPQRVDGVSMVKLLRSGAVEKTGHFIFIIRTIGENGQMMPDVRQVLL